MITEEQKQKYIEELRDQVENHPKSYAAYINCEGFKNRRPNRQYLRDFIAEQTPLLCDEKYTIPTKVYWILNGITSWDDPRVRCEQCRKPFIDQNVKNALTGYSRFCSRKCQYSSEAVQQKAKDTCMKRYGVDNVRKSPDVIFKIHETKKKNGSYRTSIPEEQSYQMLKAIYPDIIRQYYSDEYPFRCDFFVPTENLYIEGNFNWLHGKMFFHPDNEECKKKLAFWTEKAKTFPEYQEAILTWTVRDVKKREIAERNNLNYLAFWNVDEVKEYVRKHGMTNDQIEIALDEVVKRPSFADQNAALELYENHGQECLEKYRTWKFPYYQVYESTMRWEIDSLKNKSLADNQYSPMIRKFHRSFWSCSVNDCMSPIDYWEKFKEVSGEKWKKFYLTRLHCARTKSNKDGILRPWVIREGITCCKNCHLVSYLKPFLAKRLISTYLLEFSSIFCPMNGFSGFMLGAALGCGKEYIGQDLNAVQIQEAKELSDFLISEGAIMKDQVRLSVKDVFEDHGEYDCLVCCPPYGLKEKWNFDQNGKCLDKDLSCNEWIKVIMQHYSCRKYLFVVDDSETEFDDHIVEFIDNSSHFGSNYEKVIVI